MTIPILPEQRVSEKKKKTKEWQQQCIDALVGRGTANISGNRTSRMAKQVNYDLFNSIINLDDFTAVTKPYGVDFHNNFGQMPGKFQDYNIVRDSILQLVGEEISRPFNWKVRATGGEGLNLTDQKYKEELEYSYLALLKNALGEKVEASSPEEIEKYFKNSYKNNLEITANKLLTFLQYSLRLENMFVRGFEDGLKVAEEIYFVDIEHNEPKAILWNPINFECDKNQDSEFIEDQDWATGRMWLDRSQVLDWFGDKMTDAQKTMLRSDLVFNSTASYGQSPQVISPSYLPYFNQTSTKILTSIVAWKSEKKIGFVSYIGANGEVSKSVVDEDFEIPEELKDQITVRWEWLPRCWIGVQIGPEIYFAYERDIQFNTLQNPYKCKLPFVGRVYNCRNSAPTSLLDLLKPYQYIYNVTWYKAEQEMARAKGKKFVMDYHQLPKSKGWTPEQWMYYFDSLGVAWINSMEEGREGDANTVSKFNQFTQIDMTMSTAVTAYFAFMAKIEERVEAITGISRQRKGNINTSETVGGVERSVMQSTALTEIYFLEHNMVKEKVLEQLLEVAKFCYKDNEQGKLVFDEFSREVLNTSSLANSEFGLFVTNSTKDHRTLEALKGLAEKALSAGAIAMGDIISLYSTNSVSEVSTVIKSSEEKTQALKQQELQNQTAQIESTERIEREKMDREDSRIQMKIDGDLRKEEIRALGNIGMTNPDLNGDGQLDVTQALKLSLDQSKEEFNQIERGLKLKLESKKLDHDLQMQTNENKQQNYQFEEKLKLDKEKLKLDKEKNDIARKSLKYKKNPTAKK